MKQVLLALRSARKIEIMVILAAVCVLIIIGMNGEKAQTAASTADEIRMERILSQIEGAGRVALMLVEDKDGEYSGVVAACAGADDVKVCLEIQRALQTLTGLELNRIEVVKSK